MEGLIHGGVYFLNFTVVEINLSVFLKKKQRLKRSKAVADFSSDLDKDDIYNRYDGGVYYT